MMARALAAVLLAGAALALAAPAWAQEPLDQQLTIVIDDQRIAADQFTRSLAVEGGDTRTDGSGLRIGVALEAHGLTVHLHGVYGEARFRGTLAPLLSRLRGGRAQP